NQMSDSKLVRYENWPATCQTLDNRVGASLAYAVLKESRGGMYIRVEARDVHNIFMQNRDIIGRLCLKVLYDGVTIPPSPPHQNYFNLRQSACCLQEQQNTSSVQLLASWRAAAKEQPEAFAGRWRFYLKLGQTDPRIDQSDLVRWNPNLDQFLIRFWRFHHKNPDRLIHFPGQRVPIECSSEDCRPLPQYS